MAATEHRTPGRSRNAELTRKELLAAASLRFSLNGYDGTSIRDVARDVDVNVALISRYFGSKEGLIAAALAENPPRSWKGVPASAIPTQVVESVLATDGPTATSMVGLLRSLSHEGVIVSLRDVLEEHVAKPMTPAFEGDNAALCSDMVIAITMGIELLRNVIKKDPIASAEEDVIVSIFERLLAVLHEAS